MWMSVPQIPVRSIRISTSFRLALGSGTSSSHRPGCAFLLTNAFIIATGPLYRGAMVCDSLETRLQDHETTRPPDHQNTGPPDLLPGASLWRRRKGRISPLSSLPEE